MKKIIVLSIALLPVFFSCNNKKGENKLQQENDSLKSQLMQRDTVVNNAFESLNSIEANLNTIKEKEKIITVTTTGNVGEMSPEQKERINQDIQLIYDLMIKNKQTISRLSKKLKRSNIKIAQLEKTIENLTRQVEAKDIEIAQLKDQLAKLNFQVQNLSTNIDSLNRVTKSKDETIGQKTVALNTAYYAYGTTKELIANKVITKAGGFIGIGKNAKLATDFNKEYFTKIDITKTSTITLLGKKVKVLTTHPASSYKLEGKDGKVDKLVITDPEDFWSVSKYLVIVIE
jgi:hypothetical protein